MQQFYKFITWRFPLKLYQNYFRKDSDTDQLYQEVFYKFQKFKYIFY